MRSNPRGEEMTKHVSRFAKEYSGIPCRVQPSPPEIEIASKPMVAWERESGTPFVPVATSVNPSVGLGFRTLG